VRSVSTEFEEMRLEMATFPVHEVKFGSETRWHDGVLEINKDEIVREVFREDPRIETVDIEIAYPGESTRIWPVRDVVEPRFKVEGPGMVYPGIVGRDVKTVGQGRTHRLSNVGVVEVSNVHWHGQGGDLIDQFIDMSGPLSDLIPSSKLINVCVVVEPDTHLDIHEQNYAVHNATLIVSEALARVTADLDAPDVTVYENPTPTTELPKVVYIQCVHSPQAMSHSTKTFCVSIYGFSELTPPWVLHPNEVMDGAISGPYRTMFATSWTTANNPVVEELYRRHNVDLDFRAVIGFKTEWTTQREKELSAYQAAKMAKMLGADGAIVSWDAGGNEFMEVIYTVRALEQLGIKTVFLTSEDNPVGGVSTMLVPIPEADAIVSTGYFHSMLIDELKEKLPGVDRVIGNPDKNFGRSPVGSTIETPGERASDPTFAPSRFDDHYGFTRLSTFAY
jgi:glycine reductase complex component B subunit alpha and beta